MNRIIEKRLTELESKAGVGGRIYVFRIIFDEGICDYSQASPEVRWLMQDDGSEKGHFIRQLRLLELVPEAEGGSEPWELNSHYIPDPEERERMKQAYYKEHGRDSTGAYIR